MMEEKFGKYTINFDNPDQIMNMGGPWVANILIKGRPIADAVLIDNMVYNESSDKLFFVKYNKISKWIKDSYFTISSFELEKQNLTEYTNRFDMIFIKKILTDLKLEITKDFHGEGNFETIQLHKT